MTFNLTASPDFPPDNIAGWYIFNTWMQRKLDVRIHFELYDDFESQRQAFEEEKVDLIYANPFDAVMLVREKGFVAVAAPVGKADEAVVAVLDESPIRHIEDLKPGTRVAATDDPDVNMIGRIMLEPADLNAKNVAMQTVNSYTLVAKNLLRGQADVGYFLKDAYDQLSPVVRKQLRPLVTSQISVVRHVLLVCPRFKDHREHLVEALLAMNADPAGQRVLESLGLKGWEIQTQEDTEFMIDLMDTLTV
ncbi:MAG: phosphate/phosphite/phosphonate ABC transporter substrate-binding protein [Leptothrix ochracea]|uniref:phosphate/phosphite/phosphonate ABC transporter substrate-binding protein n=1 Tax=Leptothrix ochracea TaxID=735331 RepID=UPI0034E285F8